MEQESKFNYSQYSEKIAELERDLEDVDSEISTLKADFLKLDKSRKMRGMAKEQKDAIADQMVEAQRKWRELTGERNNLLFHLRNYKADHGMDLHLLEKRKTDNKFIN